MHTFCNLFGFRVEIGRYERDTPSRGIVERLAGRIREKERRKSASYTAAD